MGRFTDDGTGLGGLKGGLTMDLGGIWGVEDGLFWVVWFDSAEGGLDGEGGEIGVSECGCFKSLAARIAVVTRMEYFAFFPPGSIPSPAAGRTTSL